MPQDAAQRNEVKEKKKKDAKALFLIQQALDDAIFPRVMAATTSKAAWESLEKEYLGAEKVVTVKLQTMRRDFENLQMKSSESVQEFFSRILLVVNQIKALGEELTDQKVVERVLRSLPSKFDHVVAAIEESKDLTNYSLQELMGSLQAHEQRINRSTETSLQQAFKSKVEFNRTFEDSAGRGNSSRGRGRSFRGKGRGRKQPQNFLGGGNHSTGCSNCGRTNHVDKDCWYKETYARNKNSIQCYYCKKFGHIEKNCYKKAAESSNLKEENDVAEENLFLACLSAERTTYVDVWYLDSGCSNHMTGNKNLFLDIDKSMTSEVRMGDNNRVKVCGIGTVVVLTKFGRKLLHNVMYVPGLAQNLISVGQLMKMGYLVAFKDDKCMIYGDEGKRLLSTIQMTSDRMFPLELAKISLNAFKVSSN